MYKKRILTILACVLMLINVFAFSACANETGTFYSLWEAYDNGLLTKDDLLSIAYYNNFNSNWGNEEIMPEDFEPQPKNPEVLNEELDIKIRKVWAKNNKKTADDYYIYGYFGIYNDCVIIKMDARAVFHPQVEQKLKVDDVTFYYTGPFLSVYCMED